MERTRFWSRVGQWFQGVDSASDENGGRSARPEAGVGPTAGDDVPQSDAARSAVAARWTVLGRTSARSAEAEQLHVHLREMAEESRATHVRQAEAFTSARRILDDVRKLLAEIAAGAEVHRGLMERVAGRTDDQAACARRSEQSLSQLPKMADTQQALMASLTQHLELSRQTTEKAAGAIERLHATLAEIGAEVAASAEAVEELRRGSSESENAIVGLIRTEARRIIWFAGAAIGVLVISGVAGWIAVFR